MRSSRSVRYLLRRSASGSFNFATAGDGQAHSPAPCHMGSSAYLPGSSFQSALLMVVIAGAELFTGNNMIVMAWASGRVTTHALLTNWAIVYGGNCFGALATATIMFITTQYSVRRRRGRSHRPKHCREQGGSSFVPALTLGIMCNALVCLAVWMCYAARTTVDRVVTVVPPIAAFVASGFEHSSRTSTSFLWAYSSKPGARLILGDHQKLARAIHKPHLGQFHCSPI